MSLSTSGCPGECEGPATTVVEAPEGTFIGKGPDDGGSFVTLTVNQARDEATVTFLRGGKTYEMTYSIERGDAGVPR